MVLVVDDTDSVRKLLVADLAQDGNIRVEQASTGAEALEMAASPECAACSGSAAGASALPSTPLRSGPVRACSTPPVHRQQLRRYSCWQARAPRAPE